MISSEDRDVVLPKDIVKFTLHMAQECERTSKKFYEEADKTPDLEIKIRSSQQGTIYSNMQILFGMMYVTISSFNAMSDKLSNKGDIESLKFELTHKQELYLGSLKRDIDEWKQCKGKADSSEL